jgi:hypothetical protein
MHKQGCKLVEYELIVGQIRMLVEYELIVRNIVRLFSVKNFRTGRIEQSII